jgi:hypothetical protein
MYSKFTLVASCETFVCNMLILLFSQVILTGMKTNWSGTAMCGILPEMREIPLSDTYLRRAGR